MRAASTKARNTRMGQGEGGKMLRPQAKHRSPIRAEEKAEQARDEVVIDLEFPIDLAFGFRLAIPAPPLPAVNFIIKGAKTVFIGG